MKLRAQTARAVLAAGLAAVVAAGSAQAQEKITYLIPAPPVLPAFAPWQLAKHLGFYKEQGYEVEFQLARGGVDMAKQLGAGNAPFGGALGDTPILVRPNGVPVKAVALIGHGSFVVVVARKDRGISQLADIKGKKMAALSFADTTYYNALGALTAVGVSKNDVQAIAAGPRVAQFVVSGDADSCACNPDWEVDVIEGLGADKVIAFPVVERFPAMAQSLMASDEMIAKNPKMIQGMVTATLKGMEYIKADPKKAAAEYVKAVPAHAGKEALIEKIMLNYMKRTYETAPGLKVGEMSAERYAAVQKFYKEQGFIEKEVPVTELFTNQFIK